MLECYTVNKRNYIYSNSENYMFVKITDDGKSRVHLLFFFCWLELSHASSFWVTFWGTVDIGFIV